MLTQIKRYLIVMSKKLLFVLLITIFLSTPAYAGFYVQPNRFEGNMPAGETFENKFIITNSFDLPLNIVITYTDRTINPLDENWLTFPQTSITIPPNKHIYVPFKVTLPENAEGEYNAHIKFSQKPFDARPGASMVAIHYTKPIYIAVEGTEKFDFTIKGPALKNTEKPEVKTILLNTGNVHIRPTGTITITNLNDEADQYSIKFNQNAWAIIPNEQYLYTDSLKINHPIKDGTYQLKIDIQAGIENKMIEKSKNFSFKISGGKIEEFFKENDND